MVDHKGKTVNNMNSDDAARIRDRITEIMHARAYNWSYGPVTMYNDMVEYAQTVGEKLEGYTEEENPRGKGIHQNPNLSKDDDDSVLEGYTPPVPDDIRIKEIQGAKIIHPLLAICDKGDFTFVVANELIPGSFDKDEIEPFLTQLENESQDPYESNSSCRSACTGLCVGTCGNNCDGCTESCYNICSGCGTCTGECSHMCGGSCYENCKYECQDSCGGTCKGHCYGSCDTGCHVSCYAACGGTCVSGCSHTCKAGVGH